ncbi:MAG TPA: sulfatase, partial [Planctomycetes bacterium]|nr:sulfatase [Planctomycetota bacterium]
MLPKFVDEAVQFLDERKGEPQPFFLYVALAAPHTPWLPTGAATSGAGMYGDFTEQVDSELGRILAAMDRTGQADNTLVVFTSDNGPVWYPEDVGRLGHSSVGELRGMKSDSYEGGHRMPFVVRWPGHVDERSVCASTTCFTDVLPTLADVVGAPLPAGAGEDGHSLALLLADASASTSREVTVLKADASVIRVGKWKLITHLGSGGFSKPRRIDPEEGGPRGQLYDLDADLAETTNLWSERPQ